MTDESMVEALRNTATGKMFLMLEDGLPGDKVKAINPDGHVITVTEGIFDQDRVAVLRGEFDTVFTKAQLAALDKYNENMGLVTARDVEAATHHESPQPAKATRTTSRSSSTAGPSPRAKARNPHHIVQRWNADHLTFYRHKIDPLRDNDQFAVVVEGEGEYVMTKAQFQNSFNNVIMSSSYRSQGHYKFEKTPDNAKQFLRASGPK